jgi:hypothetical protein
MTSVAIFAEAMLDYMLRRKKEARGRIQLRVCNVVIPDGM